MTTDKLIGRYIRDLEHELQDLPRGRRREVADEFRAHIAEEAPATEAELRAVLDRLGSPADIADELRDRGELPARRRGNLTEIIALVMLPIGGVVVPFVGWLIGVALLWSSALWTTRDKVIGTLVVPGGVLPFAWFLVAGGGQVCTSDNRGGEVCEPDYSDLERALMLAGLAFLLFAPFVTVVYLARRLRRAP